MKESELYTSELFNACHVLFGQEIDVSVDFIQYLQMPGLKAAFRKKALETHPDRAAFLDCQAPDLEGRFKQVNAAYRDLSTYIENPMKFVLINDCARNGQTSRSQGAHFRPKSHPRSNYRPRDKQDGSSFKGKVPDRKCLFGRFLYYNGLITYQELIEAIVWQKVQRPAIGNLALRWQWLYDQQIKDILGKKRLGERFGECALRHGYLTPDKLRMLLGRQNLLQPRIGKYFVENRILSAMSVERMAERMRHHNRQCNMK